jgi:hypothetical protein
MATNRCEIDDQVYRALRTAADRIGSGAYRAGLYKVKYNRKGQVVHGYRLTEAHERVLDTLNAYCRGKLTKNDAMAVLHEYDVSKARLGKGR